MLIGQLALETGFSEETLTEQMNLTAGQRAPGQKKDAGCPPSLRAASPGQASTENQKAQELLLSLFASGQIPKDMLEEKDFEDDELKSLYRELLSGASPSSLPDLAPDDASRSRYTRILLYPSAGDTDEMIAMANDCLKKIRRARLEKRYKELTDEISADPGDRLPALLEEAQTITAKLQKLK